MPPEGFILSESDVAALRGMIRQLRQTNFSNLRETLEGDEYDQSPEVYVAITPSGGIPALVGITPGSAECSVYQIVNGLIENVPNVTRTIYNLSPFVIGGFQWIIVQRDKYGNWLVIGGEHSLNPCEGSLTPFYTHRYRCEAQAGTQPDLLKEYRRQITLYYKANGCLDVDIGEEEYVQTVGCCDADCADFPPDTGTGTGTGTAGPDTGTGPDTPTETTCCPGGIPAQLALTVTDKTGSCTCIGDSFTMTYIESQGWWAADHLCGPASFSAILTCPEGGSSWEDLQLNISGSIGVPDSGGSCGPPLMLVFSGMPVAICAGSATFTITEVP